jgi:carbon storage regulator
MGMLVLSREIDQSVMIGDDIEVTVIDIRSDKVRLGFRGPRDMPIHRIEIYNAIKREAATATAADAAARAAEAAAAAADAAWARDADTAAARVADVAARAVDAARVAAAAKTEGAK